MKELITITDLLTKPGHKNFPFIDPPKSYTGPTLEQLFIRGLKQRIFSNDMDVVEQLYPGRTPDDQKYRMVKSRVRYKLYDMMLILPITNNPDLPSEQECLGYITRAKILLQAQEFELAEKHAKKAATIAKEGGFTELSLIVWRMLRTIYSTLDRPRLLREAIKTIKSHEELLQAEEEATSLFDMHSHLINRSAYSRQVFSPKTPAALKKLEAIWKKTNSNTVFEKLYRLTIAHFSYEQNFHAVLEYCTLVEAQLKKNAVSTERFDFRSFYHTQVLAFIKTKSYNQGLIVAKAGSELEAVSDAERLHYTEHYFILALRAQKFSLAETICKNASARAKVHKNQLEVIHWEILHGYLGVAKDNAKLTSAISFEKTREGITRVMGGYAMYIRLTILEIAYAFKNENVSSLFDLVQSLSHLLDGYRTENAIEITRLVAFKQLLMILLDTGFNPDKIASRSKAPLARLLGAIDPYSPTEVIPFDTFWSMLVKALMDAHEELRFGKQ